jgi:hypothetical protein
MRVRPPAMVHDPLSVYVLDYGIHSSLLLPAGAEHVEFAFGEWGWFAENRQEWYRVLRLLLPASATLGKRSLPDPETAPVLGESLGLESMLELRVERAKAEALYHRLSRKYERQKATEIYNPLVQMTFVHDPIVYTLCGNNCNWIMAQWLEELGCRVKGLRIEADYLLETDAPHSPHASDAKAASPGAGSAPR